MAESHKILTKALCAYGLEGIGDLGVTPEVQVLGLHKITVNGYYLPPEMVSILISLKKYPVLSETYSNIYLVDNPERDSLDQYLNSWDCAKKQGILTCGEDSAFYGTPGSWAIFCIELSGALMKHGLLSTISTQSGAGSGEPLPQMYFQLIGLIRVPWLL